MRWMEARNAGVRRPAMLIRHRLAVCPRRTARLAMRWNAVSPTNTFASLRRSPVVAVLLPALFPPSFERGCLVFIRLAASRRNARESCQPPSPSTLRCWRLAYALRAPQSKRELHDGRNGVSVTMSRRQFCVRYVVCYSGAVLLRRRQRVLHVAVYQIVVLVVRHEPG